MQAYSEHAGKPSGTVDVDDVMLAIQSRTAYTFVQPPTLDNVAGELIDTLLYYSWRVFPQRFKSAPGMSCNWEPAGHPRHVLL